jgi:hypothetical protein
MKTKLKEKMTVTRSQRPDETNFNAMKSKNKIDATTDTTKRNFNRNKNRKTESHKAQILQAAVCFQGCCNRFCAVVADQVVALHSKRQPSHNTMQKRNAISA